MTTIAAVVVTYNRKNLLVECLDALLKQTRPLDRIFIIDNASSDGTQDLLQEMNLLGHPLISYRQMGKNTGGAGGFHEGLKTAFDEGYDWIWVMDDDAEPALDAAEKLEPYLGCLGVAAVAPMLTDKYWNMELIVPHRGFFIPFQKADGGGYKISNPVSKIQLESQSAVEIDHCSFVGLCVSSQSVLAVGLPRMDFFIHYDDSEYCTRLNHVGKILLIKNSLIRHKEAARVGELEKQSKFGLRSQRVSFDKLWICYYAHRNLVWLLSRGIVPGNRFKVFQMHFRKIASIIIYDDHKLVRLRFWNSAFIDGILGRFDNDKPKYLLNNNYV